MNVELPVPPGTVFYLAGQMTGLPNFNYSGFAQVAGHLRSLGLVVINPAEEFGGNPHLHRTQYLRKAIHSVMECDGVVCMPNWIMSEGAKLEVSVAHQLDKKVYLLLGFTNESPVMAEILPEHLFIGATEEYVADFNTGGGPF